MKLNDLRRGAFAAALLAAAMIGSPAMANTAPESAFAALQNVETQSLTAAEMQAIAGELNAAEIAAGLTALAAKLAPSFPRLAAAYAALAAYTVAHAAEINAKLLRLGLYTP
jgi:hypothetical protein